MWGVTFTACVVSFSFVCLLPVICVRLMMMSRMNSMLISTAHIPPYNVSLQEIWVLILRGKSTGCFYFLAPEQQQTFFFLHELIVFYEQASTRTLWLKAFPCKPCKPWIITEIPLAVQVLCWSRDHLRKNRKAKYRTEGVGSLEWQAGSNWWGRLAALQCCGSTTNHQQSNYPLPALTYRSQHTQITVRHWPPERHTGTARRYLQHFSRSFCYSPTILLGMSG